MKKTSIIILTLLFLCVIIYLFTEKMSDDKDIKEKSTEQVVKVENDAEMSKHLSFKGVPINGTLDEYVKAMEKVGFEKVDNKEGFAELIGDFAGYKNCRIFVCSLKGVNVVNTITVQFPIADNWDDLQSNYDKLKAMLTQKYGKPSKVVEEFQEKGFFAPKTNGEKIHCLIFDRCKWFSVFSTAKGDIELSMVKVGISDCSIVLKYFDKINTNKVNTSAINDL